MKKFLFIALVLLATVYLTGCGKKEQALEEMQEPLSMEALTALNATTQAIPESKVPEVQGAPLTETKLEPLPPSGPYKPTAQEIQTALKNAGYYAGLIDGKIGPMTKKAIEEFQKANGLKDDGKVGPKTWAVLSAYMNLPARPQLKKKE